jgi:hypothetical protein
MFNMGGGQGTNAESAYSQLGSGMLPKVAQMFMQHFAGVNTPQAQQFAQMDPNTVTPGQVAQMHEYAAQNHPGILSEVMQHPQITSALGGFAKRELEQRLGGGQNLGGLHI